jgi:outer membrane immunogenic protein
MVRYGKVFFATVEAGYCCLDLAIYTFVTQFSVSVQRRHLNGTGKTMNRALTVSALALFAASAAQAADVYSNGTYKDAPFSASAPVWTGPFVGVGVVGAYVNHDISHIQDSAKQAEVNGLAGFGAGADFLIGYRYQLPASRFVFGVEAEYDILNASASANDTVVDQLKNPSLNLTDRWAILGTVGFAVSSSTLAYAGVGYGQELFHSNAVANVNTTSKVGDFTVDGAVVKGGLEVKLPWITPGLFARAEYEYFAANEATLVTWTIMGPHAHSITDTADTNSAKLVIGYQIDGGYAPLK